MRQISEAVMGAVFLRGELGSPRYGPVILNLVRRAGLNTRIIDEPDLASAAENDTRRTILASYRGFGRNANVFTGFPEDVSWFRAMATPEDLFHTLYIDYDY